MIYNDNMDTNIFISSKNANKTDKPNLEREEEHPLIKHSIQINRTKRNNLYLLCMLFIFVFFIIPLIVFFESMKKNENLNVNKISLRK